MTTKIERLVLDHQVHRVPPSLTGIPWSGHCPAVAKSASVLYPDDAGIQRPGTPGPGIRVDLLVTCPITSIM